MMTHGAEIVVREVTERFRPRGGVPVERSVYHVVVNGTSYAVTPDRDAALRCARERAFISGLLAADPASVGAIALWCRSVNADEEG